jgi:hypothetical protein
MCAPRRASAACRRWSRSARSRCRVPVRSRPGDHILDRVRPGCGRAHGPGGRGGRDLSQARPSPVTSATSTRPAIQRVGFMADDVHALTAARPGPSMPPRHVREACLSWITLIGPEEAPAPLLALYERIRSRSRRGQVAHIWQAMGADVPPSPPLRALPRADGRSGALTVSQAELIAVVVSATNGCSLLRGASPARGWPGAR